MRITNIIIFSFSLIIISITEVQSQTLWNGVGHIPAYNQVTWNVAGL